jgi:hypothetical protein
MADGSEHVVLAHELVEVLVELSAVGYDVVSYPALAVA